MNSKLKDTPTTQDAVNGLDDLFADLLKSKSSPSKSEPNHDSLLSKFLDEEMDGSKTESLAPDLDQKLSDALREIGFDSSMRDATASAKATPKKGPAAEAPVQPANKESAHVGPASPHAAPPVSPAKPAVSGAPAPEKGVAPAAPAAGKAKGMAAKAKPSRSISIMSSTPVPAAGGNKTKPIVFGLVGLAVVGALAFYFMSGSKSTPTQPANTSQVESPVTPSSPGPSAEPAASRTAATPSAAAASKPPAIRTETAPASTPDPKEQINQTAKSTPAPPPVRSAAPVSGVTTWSVTESLGNSQNLPTPATSVVRGPDMPMPAAMAPNASAQAASAPKPAAPTYLMTPPQPLTKVSPTVPEMVRKLKVSGIVRVNAKVDDKGRVTTAIAESGPAMLRNSAEVAVRQWKFKPAQSNGSPIASETTILIDYK